MKQKLRMVIISILVCWVLIVPLTPSQTLPNSRKQASQSGQKAPLLKIPTASLFTQLLLAAQKPGGIAIAASCTEPSLQTVFSEDAPLNVKLKEIVIVDPQYRLEDQNGVINLLPRTVSDPAFLKVKISKFEVKQVSSVSEALDKLLSLPEVKRQETAFGPRLLRGGLGFVSLSKRFDVECSSCSMREALNAIARAQGQAVWVYKQIQCDAGHRYFSLDFLVP